MPRLSDEEKRLLQIEELSVLNEIKRVCDRHGIKYFITAGTLLGAVRHGGFIPWDDDIDIAMLREDYEHFGRICRAELRPGFFYQSEKTERDYPFGFAKVRRDNTEVREEILDEMNIHKGCYVDIFPLDKCPSTKILAKTMFKLSELFTSAIISKYSKSFECGYKKALAKMIFHLTRILPVKVLKLLRRASRACFSSVSSGGRLATVYGSHGYPKETYHRSWFESSVSLKFENGEYPAPIGYKELLTNMYGDYMTPPNDEEKYGHFKK